MVNQPPTEVAMEAGYSSHYWARRFTEMGHTVKLLPAQHVTPFVRGNKSDHNDAVAIAEAARRPNILPVPVKTVEQCEAIGPTPNVEQTDGLERPGTGSIKRK